MTSPSVELRFNPTDLRPRDLPSAGAFLGSPADALEAALAVARAEMVDKMRNEIRGLAEPTEAQLLRIADLAWQAAFWNFRKISAPVMAEAYIRAYRRAEAGDVPLSVIHSLADLHAEKIGDYFHKTSKDALSQGFATMVNRRLPAKAAAGKVMDAYGLSPRQMRAFTSAKQLDTPIDSPISTAVKARIRAYVDKSFTSRTRKLSRQEEHNIDQQAQQYAWMWLQEKGRLGKQAEKVWITARDERVCPVCGPLHNQRVRIDERFVTQEGEFWTPGLHPNCRCVVRLIENRFGKAQSWDPRKHHRGGDPENRGRFSRRPGPQFKEPERQVIETSDIWQSLRERTVDEPEEVIETAPVKARLEPVKRVSLEGTGKKVSLGSGKVNLSGGKVDLTRGVDLTQQKPDLSQEKAKVRLSSEEVKERIALMVTPQMRVAMDADLMAALRADAARPARPRERKLYYKPTIKIQDENGRQYPVYAVVDPVDVGYGTELMELTHDVQFSPNLDQVAAEAYTRFEEAIDAVYQDMSYTGNNRFKTTTEDGGLWTAELDDELLLNVIAWKAYQGRVTDSDWGAENSLDIVVWKDPNGAEWPQTMRYSEIAERLQLADEDFDIKILRLDEGHDSRLGTTAQVSARTTAGEEDWITSGLYRGEPAEDKELHRNVSMRIWQLEPEVDEEELETPFD